MILREFALWQVKFWQIFYAIASFEKARPHCVSKLVSASLCRGILVERLHQVIWEIFLDSWWLMYWGGSGRCWCDLSQELLLVSVKWLVKLFAFLNQVIIKLLDLSWSNYLIIERYSFSWGFSWPFWTFHRFLQLWSWMWRLLKSPQLLEHLYLVLHIFRLMLVFFISVERGVSLWHKVTKVSFKAFELMWMHCINLNSLFIICYILCILILTTVVICFH